MKNEKLKHEIISKKWEPSLNESVFTIIEENDIKIIVRKKYDPFSVNSEPFELDPIFKFKK